MNEIHEKNLMNIRRSIRTEYCHLLYISGSDLIWSINKQWYRAAISTGLCGDCAKTGDIIRVMSPLSHRKFHR
jgi:hypothetical protein